jgi:hypothetical protein
MSTDDRPTDDRPTDDRPTDEGPTDAQARDLPPAARRALAEAEARRRKAEAAAQPMPRELGGRDGPEPVRYGDWELKGLAIDF